MYKSFILHDHDIKFHIPDMKEDKRKKDDMQYTNNKDYETIGKASEIYRSTKEEIKYVLRYIISMVEVIANSLEDTLIDGLLSKLSKTASYTTHRRSRTYQPQGRNSYTLVNGTNC